jgi:hypothetical protein
LTEQTLVPNPVANKSKPVKTKRVVNQIKRQEMGFSGLTPYKQESERSKQELSYSMSPLIDIQLGVGDRRSVD